MFYYIKKTNDHIDILGSIDLVELIPQYCEECTENEYNQYCIQMEIQKYGTIQQQGLNQKIEDIRSTRQQLFSAFDIYKTNVTYGLITETENEKQTILTWYQDWLNLPNGINLENYNNVIYPITPVKIEKYIIK